MTPIADTSEHGPEQEATPASALGKGRQRRASSRCTSDAHPPRGNVQGDPHERWLASAKAGRPKDGGKPASTGRSSDGAPHHRAVRRAGVSLARTARTGHVRGGHPCGARPARAPPGRSCPACGACIGVELDCTCWKTSVSVREPSLSRVPTRGESTRSRLRDRAPTLRNHRMRPLRRSEERPGNRPFGSTTRIPSELVPRTGSQPRRRGKASDGRNTRRGRGCMPAILSLPARQSHLRRGGPERDQSVTAYSMCIWPFTSGWTPSPSSASRATRDVPDRSSIHGLPRMVGRRHRAAACRRHEPEADDRRGVERSGIERCWHREGKPRTVFHRTEAGSESRVAVGTERQGRLDGAGGGLALTLQRKARND
jgi:hypothetical protein